MEGIAPGIERVPADPHRSHSRVTRLATRERELARLRDGVPGREPDHPRRGTRLEREGHVHDRHREPEADHRGRDGLERDRRPLDRHPHVHTAGVEARPHVHAHRFPRSDGHEPDERERQVRVPEGECARRDAHAVAREEELDGAAEPVRRRRVKRILESQVQGAAEFARRARIGERLDLDRGAEVERRGRGAVGAQIAKREGRGGRRRRIDGRRDHLARSEPQRIDAPPERVGPARRDAREDARVARVPTQARDFRPVDDSRLLGGGGTQQAREGEYGERGAACRHVHRADATLAAIGAPGRRRSPCSRG